MKIAALCGCHDVAIIVIAFLCFCENQRWKCKIWAGPQSYPTFACAGSQDFSPIKSISSKPKILSQWQRHIAITFSWQLMMTLQSFHTLYLIYLFSIKSFLYSITLESIDDFTVISCVIIYIWLIRKQQSRWAKMWL